MTLPPSALLDRDGTMVETLEMLSPASFERITVCPRLLWPLLTAERLRRALLCDARSVFRVCGNSLVGGGPSANTPGPLFIQ